MNFDVSLFTRTSLRARFRTVLNSSVYCDGRISFWLLFAWPVPQKSAAVLPVTAHLALWLGILGELSSLPLY
jgi:hypothetical protein